MPKLTDTQLVILNRAAQRDDLAVATIDKRPATRDAIEALLKQKLLNTTQKTNVHALWARGDNDAPLGLTVTPKGLKAIGVAEGAETVASAPSAPEKVLAAAKVTTKKPAKGKSKPKASPKKPVGKTDKPGGATPQRSGTKLDTIIKMMSRMKGASVQQMMTETGWQAHSVRGAISGAIKKKLGLSVISERVGEERLYRIAGK